MPVRRLLKSCATPPASRPTASSFGACRNCSSSRFCSVTSKAIAHPRQAGSPPFGQAQMQDHVDLAAGQSGGAGFEPERPLPIPRDEFSGNAAGSRG